MTTEKILDENYSRYKENYKDIYKKYPGKILVISKKSIIKAFDTIGDAYNFGCSEIGLGKFLLQKCEKHLEVINFHGVYQLN